MASSSSQLLAVWASRKAVASSAYYCAAVEISSYHLAPTHPVWSFVARRLQHTPASLGRSHLYYYEQIPLDRWKQNVSRIYARRILEIAATSAATYRFVTELEQVIETPADWENWERKEWEDELLQSLGESKLSRVWTAFSRICSLSVLAAPYVLMYPFAQVSQSIEKYSWSYALWGIEQAGPTFTKLVVGFRLRAARNEQRDADDAPLTFLSNHFCGSITAMGDNSCGSIFSRIL